MNIRLMTMTDVGAGMRLKDLAGWNQTSADWERFLSASPDGCFVAEAEGRVVGTVTTIAYQGRFGWIGMVLVDPEFRGRGIGTRLLNRAIENLDSRSIPTLKLDATPQGKPIYEKLGFVSEYEVERWTLARPARGTTAHTLGPPRLEDVLELDGEVFGADRSALLRTLVSAAPDFTLAVREHGGLAGYAFGRRGSVADHLGPWTAQQESVACELLDEFLARSSRDKIFVDCLKSNPFAKTLLRARGFEFSRPLTRMVRGPNDHPGRPEWLCAVLGPEFG